MSPPIYRLAVSLETALYGLIGLIAERGITDPFGDDLLAGPLTMATDAAAHAELPWPKAS